MWIIQNKIFRKEQNPLISALIDLSIETRVVGHNYCSFSDGTEQAIFRGSVDFVSKNSIGALTLKHYNCSHYYGYYLDSLLNKDFLFIPWRLLGLYKDNLFRYLDTDELFIRPNSGRKIFTGNYLTKEWFEKDIDAIINLPGNSEPKSNDLVVLSSRKKIGDEFRVLMHKYHAIDCSVYSDDDSIAYLNSFVCKAAEDIANKAQWYPDDFYVMDLTYHNDFELVEINNLFSAGWYDCDYKKVIKYIEENKND